MRARSSAFDLPWLNEVMEDLRGASMEALSGEALAWESRCVVGFSSMVGVVGDKGWWRWGVSGLRDKGRSARQHNELWKISDGWIDR